jgi:hypothetical protein
LDTIGNTPLVDLAGLCLSDISYGSIFGAEISARLYVNCSDLDNLCQRQPIWLQGSAAAKAEGTCAF